MDEKIANSDPNGRDTSGSNWLNSALGALPGVLQGASSLVLAGKGISNAPTTNVTTAGGGGGLPGGPGGNSNMLLYIGVAVVAIIVLIVVLKK